MTFRPKYIYLIYILLLGIKAIAMDNYSAQARLSSIAERGIIPAVLVEQYVIPIPSSEELLLDCVCANVVTLTGLNAEQKRELFDSIVFHDTHGFINMAIERPELFKAQNIRDF